MNSVNFHGLKLYINGTILTAILAAILAAVLTVLYCALVFLLHVLFLAFIRINPCSSHLF